MQYIFFDFESTCFRRMRVCMSAWVETATPPSNCSCTTSYRRYVMAFSQACFWRCWCHGLDWAPNCVNRNQQLIDESTFCNYIQPSYLLWQDICRRSSSSLLKCQVVGVAAESRWQISVSAHLQRALPASTQTLIFVKSLHDTRLFSRNQRII